MEKVRFLRKSPLFQIQIEDPDDPEEMRSMIPGPEEMRSMNQLPDVTQGPDSYSQEDQSGPEDHAGSSQEDFKIRNNC